MEAIKMTFEEQLKKYAKLVVEVGVNVQEGQIVVIRTPVEGAIFARELTRCAYEVGAKRVIAEYSDEQVGKLTYTYASEETLGEFPDWEVLKYETLVKENAAFISINAGDPDLLRDIPSSKISTAQKASGKALGVFRKAISNSDVCWCVVSIPTPSWSKKLFPHLDEKKAEETLWEKIFSATRVNEQDPVAAWKKHTDDTANRCKFLNQKRIKSLHYKGPGTDLTVELPKQHKWEGAGDFSTKGTYFVANMPTEEVYTMPHKYSAEGILASTKPLVYGGNLIEDFSFTFKKGKIVDFDARVGKEILGKLLETDKGSCYLGEVAIVPNSSPVSKAGIIFFNTLFDENASCHFAIGSSYPTNIEGGTKMSEEELEKVGANTSITHNDFMVGGPQLNITATTWEGEIFKVLENGEWAF